MLACEIVGSLGLEDTDGLLGIWMDSKLCLDTKEVDGGLARLKS